MPGALSLSLGAGAPVSITLTDEEEQAIRAAAPPAQAPEAWFLGVVHGYVRGYVEAARARADAAVLSAYRSSPPSTKRAVEKALGL
jgi:hypothetical protein